MTSSTLRRRLAAVLAVCGATVAALIGTQPALAQTSDQASSSADAGLTTVVVTGSRIRRDASDTTTDAPLAVVTVQEITDRGYTQVGDALNQLTSNTPSFAQTQNTGVSSGSGQQFPNLFNLGAGRTLTLVNGRRFVNSGVGLGDSTVDTNMIPLGLLERVEVVQGGGSVVYGSDAIAGAVNYILKDHFTGAELDARTGVTSHNDYPQTSVRATLGTNFLQDRGNIAVNLEWSKTDPLLQNRRSEPGIGYAAADGNPLDTGPHDGIPSTAPTFNSTFWEFNNTGVLFSTPPGAPYQAAFGGGFFITQNGVHYPGGNPVQFNAAGTALVPYNPGRFPPGTGPAQSFVSPPFASGGDGFPYEDLTTLYTGVERHNVNVIGHLDLTSNVKLSTELLYAHTRGNDPLANNVSNTVLNNFASGAGAISIAAANPYLPAAARGTIANYLNTTYGGGLGFAWLGGAPIPGLVDLSKNWTNLVPNLAGITSTDTVRALFALDGNFNWGARDYSWNVSASRGHSESTFKEYNVLVSQFNNAINAVTNGSGQIVCGVNNPAVTDSACVPINPFGSGAVSTAAQNYVTGVFGQKQFDTEDDVLATLGGKVVELPAGPMKFSATYEHRADRAEYDPLQDTALGLGPSGAPTPSASGQYHTNEVSTELLLPLVGKDFTMPGVKALELDGAYRYVDNSLAGNANLWNLGLRWTVLSGVTLRASHGTNFRAPNLNEVFAPPNTVLNSVGDDPCDARNIASGPNPTVRRANCEALFAAHPSYNGGNGLAGYQDPAENFSTAAVTTVGNADLSNEISHTWTYGIVLEPQFAPGLTFVADRIEIKLVNAISQFNPVDFMAACYDSSPQPANVCGTFTRDSNGDVVAAKAEAFNAGRQNYKGETYNLGYRFAAGERGHVELNLGATHNEINDLSVTGSDLTRIAGTSTDPRWVAKFDAAYAMSALRLTYSLFYLPRTPVMFTSTIENTPYPVLPSNAQHNLSMQYQWTSNLTLRAGVINLTNEQPSFPTITYGDVLGRRYFAGINMHF